MDTTEALTELNTELGDADNFALTQAEKERAIAKAWNDRYVVEETWDSSLTYDDSTQQYTLPTGMRNVISVAQDPENDGFKAEISADGFNIVAGKLHIKDKYRTILTNAYTLWLWGHKKLTTSDSITNEDLQEYVLKLAQYNAIDILLNKKTLKFVKNDTSVAELVAVKNQLKDDIREFRQVNRVIAQEM